MKEFNLEAEIKKLNLQAEFPTPDPIKTCCYNCDWLTFNQTINPDRWYCEFHGFNTTDPVNETCFEFQKEDF